ncbi:hypothetical protein ALC62_00194 [Cyphomyrmex costatus]|uniref:Uncharacterized protein n=1 Tax=Cyphomyrmex costatus TaxID=456900 RepID=A0A195D7A1_9HYME|nr:hypothetical protein ALC62_00194 [Cyphomyrmex costatus]
MSEGQSRDRGVKGSAIEGHDEEKANDGEGKRERESAAGGRKNVVRMRRDGRPGMYLRQRHNVPLLRTAPHAYACVLDRTYSGGTGTGIGQRGAFGAFLHSLRRAPERMDGRTNERTDGHGGREGGRERGGGSGIREGRKAKGARAREESSATRHATLDRRT